MRNVTLKKLDATLPSYMTYKGRMKNSGATIILQCAIVPRSIMQEWDKDAVEEGLLETVWYPKKYRFNRCLEINEINEESLERIGRWRKVYDKPTKEKTNK